MESKAVNFHAEILPDGKGGYDFHVKGKIMESYRTENEDGTVRARMIASTAGYLTVSSADGKAVAVFNANVLFPRPTVAKKVRPQAFRVYRDKDGKETRVPIS